jgi:CVNH domain
LFPKIQPNYKDKIMKTTTTTKTKLNSKQFYSRITAAIGVTLLTATVASPAFARSPSTYQYSCRNISLNSNVLYATCKKRDGNEKKTAVLLRGIDNQNGYLVDTGSNSPATFSLSCYSTGVTGNQLSGICFKINRAEAVLSITLIQGIRNDNGNLTY